MPHATPSFRPGSRSVGTYDYPSKKPSDQWYEASVSTRSEGYSPGKTAWIYRRNATTYRALTWTWYLLSLNREVEEKLHRELATVLGDRVPSAEDLPRLTYTHAVAAETMRLYPPPFTLGRQVLKKLHIGNTFLPQGSSVILSPYVTHRDPRFFADPLRFDPERWRNSARPPDFAYLPFGAGTRRCVGEHFARMEILLVIATIAQRWRIRPMARHAVEVQGPLLIKPVDIPMRLEKFPTRRPAQIARKWSSFHTPGPSQRKRQTEESLWPCDERKLLDTNLDVRIQPRELGCGPRAVEMEDLPARRGQRRAALHAKQPRIPPQKPHHTFRSGPGADGV